MASNTETFGAFGLWIRHSDANAEVANLAESNGYGTLWLGGSPPEDLRIADEMLSASDELVVATGITNIWASNPAKTAANALRLIDRHAGRFVLGVGVGHREATSEYRSPMSAMNEYLDILDRVGLDSTHRVLAALGPKMLELSRDRSLGAHPYLTTPEHTKTARETLGDDALLAPEQKVVLQSDPKRARAAARPYVDNPYLHLENYLDNLRRLGYADEDFINEGSDRLIDRLAFHGDVPAIASALREHLRAGADHVAIQVLPSDSGWAADIGALAAVLGNSRPQ